MNETKRYALSLGTVVLVILGTMFVVLPMYFGGRVTCSMGSVQALPHPGFIVEVLIPKNMPIKLEVLRDESEPAIAKYIVKRLVPPRLERHW